MLYTFAPMLKNVRFVVSNSNPKLCPAPDRVEFAFIGRSNVGKSSLINMLAGQKNLAKTSGRPGKTQLINHFGVDNRWYLVDLPGYGYAKVSKDVRQGFGTMIEQYILKRENLACVMVLIDSRLDPQGIDIEFINWLGTKGVPLALVFTKADKQSVNKTKSAIARFERKLRETWEEMPMAFVTSAADATGREELTDFLEQIAQQGIPQKG